MYKMKRALSLVLLLTFIFANSTFVNRLEATDGQPTGTQVSSVATEAETASESKTDTTESQTTEPSAATPSVTAASAGNKEETAASQTSASASEVTSAPPAPAETSKETPTESAQETSATNPEQNAEEPAESRSAETEVPAFPLFTAASMNSYIARNSRAATKTAYNIINENTIIGTTHPSNPGDVMLFKEAKPVAGMVNTWDVTLRVETMDQTHPVYTVLIIDTSNSMNSEKRLVHAKAAAKSFVDIILPDEYTKNKIALVTFNDDATERSTLPLMPVR